ncbi:MAG TPA: 1-deoxy-D-xylulose-5-phosphate synthase [Phycisphaerales bacterium]|nr:1-deoxy-D-xylulose-5-phosphate synthase [Phycisphaerales bacterium]
MPAQTLLETLRTPADLRKLSIEQLPEVAADIRKAICDQIAVSGGHLAPNLGVVELTIAMHYVFDFGWDRLLFDVGHQCYPHKLLTGRLGLLKNLRTSAGMSGFPEPAESPFDLFRVGHAGTGISTAVGMARGDTLNKEGYDPATNPKGRRVATIIGDASIVNGVAMEGLNGAGILQRQFLVVLNDNGMSISKPQGAMAQYFDRVRLSHTYADLKKKGKEMLRGMPGGSLMAEAYHRAGEMTKSVFHENAWFEHFGLLTAGPVDGHDLPTLIEFLSEARDLDRPMVLHVKTIKGKGYEFAETDSSTFHSPAPFVREGCRVEIKKDGRSFTGAIGEIMVEAMGRDPKVLAATAAMPDGTGISKALAAFPERSFDTGICESHALDMMAGLAKTGFKPFFAVYSTFVQRAFDQAFQEVALQGLAVRLLLDRAGLVGGDGAVHHGFCDVALLRTLPNAAIMAVIDEPSLKECVEFMVGYEEGLSSVRYPRDNVSDLVTSRLGVTPKFELGKARCLTPEVETGKQAPDVAVLAFGTPAIDALRAADALTGEYRVAVYDARFAKPVDGALVRSLLERRIPIVTVEDHSIIGGFGAAVLEAAQEMGLDASRVVRLGLPDSWIIQDSRAKQLAQAGIDQAGIARGIRAAAELGASRPGRLPEIHVARSASPAAVAAR